MYKGLILILFSFWLTGCNRNDLDRLHNIADDHTERLARLEQIVTDGQKQLSTIHTLLLEYEQRTLITGTEALPTAGYIIRFSDGDSITINDAESPVVEISNAGTWIINGTDTGIKTTGQDGTDAIAPLIREKEGMWEISADNGKTWAATGVPLKGDTGKDAAAPTISIGENGNWFINGNDTGYKAIGTDGKVITETPKIEARENGDGSANWWICNDGTWSDTGIIAIGKDGDNGANGKSCPYITNVTVSGNRISFVFSAIVPGTTPPSNIIAVQRIIPIRLEIEENGTWVTTLSRPLAIEVNGIFQTFSCRVVADPGRTYTYSVHSAPKDFAVQPDLNNNKINIGINESMDRYQSGNIILLFTSGSKETFTATIPIETKVHRLDVDSVSFGSSFVYGLVNSQGYKIAEICSEYLSNTNQTDGKVIYPFNAVTLSRSTGCVMQEGGTVDAQTSYYNPWGNYPAGKKRLYLLDNGVFLPANQDFTQAIAIRKDRFIPETATDIDGNLYKIQKIGTQYWISGENGQGLKTTRYNTGTPIASTDISHTGNTAYSAEAILSGNLAPAGWHIPSDEEWKTTEIFMGMSPEEADRPGARENERLGLLFNNLKLTGTWYTSTIADRGVNGKPNLFQRTITLTSIDRVTGRGAFQVRCIRNR